MKRLAYISLLLLAGCSQAATATNPAPSSGPTAKEWRAVSDKVIYLEASNDDLRLKVAVMRDELDEMAKATAATKESRSN